MLNRSIAFVVRLTALLSLLPLLPPVLAQHGYHHHHGVALGTPYSGHAHYGLGHFGPGHIGPACIGPGNIGLGNVGFGNYRTSGNVIYGQPGLVQQFGGVSISSATYSSFGNSRNLFGVARIPGGSFHYSSGLVVPAIVTGSFYNYGCSPWAFGYGTGWYGPGWYDAGWYGSGWYGSGLAWPGYGVLSPGWSIDPYTGMAVNYGQWGVSGAPYSGVPYLGGVNSYFPGSILAPTLLNMNISMRPSVPSSASYTLTDPRILDLVAPAPDIMPIPDPGIPAGQQNPEMPPIPDAPPLPDPGAAGVPLLNEFEPFPRSDKASALAEKIHSLRYQATGDDSFRKEDYVSAEVFYKSAIEMAPDRKAPYLRMAFVQLALADFPEAVSYLKAGAMMPDDGTRSWVSADELYGSRVAERARSHGGKLWNWLAQQPLSSDRLLLAGTYQKLRGFDKVASELFTMASHDGPEAAYVTAINEIAASDIGQRAISHDLAQLVDGNSGKAPAPSVSHQAAVAASKAVRSSPRPAETDGIFLRGKRGAAVAVSPVPPDPGEGILEPAPVDNSRKESSVPAEIPTLVIPRP